jgi:putative hydrolase of the HAD superfamily
MLERSMAIKAVGFDFMGTLVHVQLDNEKYVCSMHSKLVELGIACSDKELMEAHDKAAKKYRKIRVDTCREIDNTVWVADALKELGYDVNPEDQLVVEAVDAYFQPFIASLRVAPGAFATLSKIKNSLSVGLISNFSYRKAIREALKRLRLDRLLDTVVISDEAGWRKPHPKIFQIFLDQLELNPDEAIYVGDDLKYDVEGARAAGMRTVLVSGSPTVLEDEIYGQAPQPSSVKPDFTIKSLPELLEILRDLK